MHIYIHIIISVYIYICIASHPYRSYSIPDNHDPVHSLTLHNKGHSFSSSTPLFPSLELPALLEVQGCESVPRDGRVYDRLHLETCDAQEGQGCPWRPKGKGTWKLDDCWSLHFVIWWFQWILFFDDLEWSFAQLQRSMGSVNDDDDDDDDDDNDDDDRDGDCDDDGDQDDQDDDYNNDDDEDDGEEEDEDDQDDDDDED